MCRKLWVIPWARRRSRFASGIFRRSCRPCGRRPELRKSRWHGGVNDVREYFRQSSRLVHILTAMKFHRTLITSLIAACVLTGAAFAAEASPAGTWKWTVQGRQGGQGFEQMLTLDFKDGTLSGVMKGRQAAQFTVPDTAISDAAFKTGEIKFSVSREFQGQKFTTKYEGKLEGDTIKGTFERPGFNGGAPSKGEWDAKRAK